MKTPISNGISQSDLDLATFKVVRANLSDYAGTNMVWNATTGKFDASIAGGSTMSAPLTLNSTGVWNDAGAHPFTPENSGIFVKDATGREILRLWSGNSDQNVVGNNNFNLYLGYEAGLMQPTDNTTAGSQNVGIGPWALRYVTIAQGCTAVGANALRYNTTGVANVAIGASALQANHTLEGSTAVGTNALKDADTGGQGGDTAVGFASLYQQHYGGDNTAVGRYSGVGTIIDNGMVFLGSGARRIGDSGVPMIDAISIGYQAEVATSHTAVIGGILHTDVYFGSVAGNSILHGKGAYPTGGTTGQVLTKNSNTAFDVGWATPSGGGAVTSVFTRTGAVVAATNDYTFAQIGSKPTTVSGYGITDATIISGTPTSGQYARWTSATTVEGVSVTTVETDLGVSNLTNDAQIKASDFPSTSVDGEISLFSGTTGKAQKRATGSGSVVAVSGVYGTVAAGAAGNIFRSDGSVWTSAPRLRVSSQASNATWSPNADTTEIFVLTLQVVAVTTINNPSGTPVDCQRLMLRAKCDGTARALTWSGSQWRASTDMPLPTTLIANKSTYLGFNYNSTDTKWDLVAKLENF